MTLPQSLKELLQVYKVGATVTDWSTGKLQKAIEARDHKRILLELELLKPYYHQINFADLISSSEKIVVQMADQKRRDKRTATVSLVVDALRGSVGDDQLDAIRMLLGHIEVFEDGYDRIRSTLQKTNFAKLSPERQISTCLCLESYQFDRVRHEIHSLLIANKRSVPHAVSLRDANDRPIPPEAVIDAIVSAAGATLKMIAGAQKWDTEGRITLPTFEILDAQASSLGGPNEILAHSWKTWNRLEELHRFNGAPFTVQTKESLPDGLPPNVKRLIRFGHAATALYQIASAYRAGDVTHQNIMENVLIQAVKDRIVPVHKPAKLPPHQFVSDDEYVAILALSEILSFSVAHDFEEYHGLRIVEWLRGLAVLSNLATAYDEGRSEDDRPILIMLDTEIVTALQRGGLTSNKAANFIDNVSFQQKSIDLFDAPLVSIAGGKKLLFLPTLVGLSHANTLLSLLSRLEVTFEDKGKAFEHRVTSLFNSAGAYAKSFSFKKRGEDFEIDALVEWEGMLFLFECKNWALPASRPVAMRRFEDGMEATVKQVLRQKVALETWPETVEAKFGKQIAGLPIIPCVLNNLPYARLGDHEGVYLYDYSSLKRFMTSGTLNARSVATFGKGDRRELRIPTLKIWKGVKPTAEDLLEQLKEPVALKILLAHTETDQRTFYLDEETLVISDEIYREDVTDKSMVELSGKSWSGVRMRQDRFAKKARKSRLKEQRSRKPATRPFWK